jgi:hypothetical protein
MDPFTLATGLVGIASLALEVTQILHSYHSSVRSASKDAETLKIVVEALGSSSKQLSRFLEIDRGNQKHFNSTASVLALTTTDCTSTLKELEKRLGGSRKQGIGKTLEQLSWPFRKEQVQAIIENLRRYNQILQFSLSIDG